MPIKVTKLSERTKKDIRVECPECGQSLFLVTGMVQKEGTHICEFCGTRFKWEETDEPGRET